MIPVIAEAARNLKTATEESAKKLLNNGHMEISGEAKEILDKLNDNLPEFLKNNFEISVIIEAALRKKSNQNFNDLIFKAKYINGLKSILSNRIVTGDDFMGKIFSEFNKNLREFSALLEKISASVKDENTEDHFKRKFFELDQESIVNIMSLIEDLTLIKEHLNKSSGEDYSILN